MESQVVCHTIDLNFQGLPGGIASYLVPHANGAVLVETGPGSTIPALQAGLETFGYRPGDISDVFLTHIHLDHGGAAGWLARQGATIHVHRNGASHLIQPEKLLASASRIYGENMGPLWGEFLPVPEERVHIVEDGDVISVDGIQVKAIDTPGHANHHFAYILGDICFTGDIGGVRLGGLSYLLLPMPPPELHFEKWHASIERLRSEEFKRVAPTHFGIFTDRAWHLDAIERALDEVEVFMTKILPGNPSQDEVRRQFGKWTEETSIAHGMDSALLKTQEIVNPAYMSADGIIRYWNKFRAN